MTDRTTPTSLNATPRRSLLKGVAVAGAAIPFIAACGSGDDEPSADPTSDSADGGNGAGAGGVLATTDQVPEGGGIILEDPGIVITQPAAGEFKGFSNICKHAGCKLSSVASGTINCNCHGSQYSIEDGSPVTGPNGQGADTIAPLDSKPVDVKGDDITLA